ncbi:MAG: proton-conducting transporter membrane subunit [Candidatus Izemoplasma sp.]
MNIASIELLILITLASGLLAYAVGRFNAKLGAVVTIIASSFVAVAVIYFGLNDELIATTDYFTSLTFEVTNLGIFFASLVTFVFAMVSFFNPFFVDKYKYPAAYSMLFLFSLAGVIGVFFVDNFMTLFVFFEFTVWSSMFLIPMGRSTKSTVIYYTMSTIGSFALLYAIFLMKDAAGTFDIADGLAMVDGGDAVAVFVLLMIAGFAKLGAFPLHLWLPKVLGDAPDPVTAVFSGGLEKMGAFIAIMGLVQLAPVGFNIEGIDMDFAKYMVALVGALTIVFGTLMAIRQDDAKKLLAYSSMSNGGYIIVALSIYTGVSVSGAFYHIIAHALASAAAFLAIAAVSRKTGTTKMSELGGMIHTMPVTYMIYLIAIISMAGIPPMGGFISKWLIFQGVIDKGLVFISIAVFIGSIGSFLYVFRPLAALFLGQELPKYKNTKEAPFFMLVPMVILGLLIVATGVFPNYILEFINEIVVDLGLVPIVLDGYTLTGNNGTLHPALIGGVFAVGVGVAFVIFMIFPKSRKVDLMDTYTAGEFIYTEELLHYSVDFYAPIERLYVGYINIMEDVYANIANKVRELGSVFKYYFFSNKPEVTVMWIIIIMAAVLGGGLL